MSLCHLPAAARSPHLWRDPEAFRPERFSEPNDNPAFNGAWAGYRPAAQGSSLYPNEVAADFAFIPFGGGARKCVGDQFALMEATVILAMLLRCVLCFAGAAPASQRFEMPDMPFQFSL